MWAANLKQLFRCDAENTAYSCWVLFVRHGAGTKKEKIIRSKHEDLSTLLAEQGVSYSEIMTRAGRQSVYSRFGYMDGKHPLFFVLSKHPLDYKKGEKLLVIEWCKWTDTEEMKSDLMAFANAFSDKHFRESVAKSQDPSRWKKVGTFLDKYAKPIVKVGGMIAAAL